MGDRSFLHEADLYFFETGKAQRAYLTFGCHRLPGGAEGGHDAYAFVTWAPHAQAVSVVGDFNGWDDTANPMERVKDHPGIWCCTVPACGIAAPERETKGFANRAGKAPAKPEMEAATGQASDEKPSVQGEDRSIHNGSAYKFAITGADGTTHLKADPYAVHAENGMATASKVWNLEGYEWHDGAWLQRRAHADLLREPVSIYEMHLGSWRTGEQGALPNYRTVADELVEYCDKMGYTHVELLPLTEHPLPASWGYQTTGYFAITSRYGTPQDFMYFVNTLHQAGIGVIMDWAPAHFPKDAFGLARFDGEPLYEYADPRLGEHAEWGTLVFDYARPQVVSFLVSSAMFLMDVYHVDGIRVDAVTSMLYLDYARTDWVPNKDGGNINLEAVEFLRTLNSALLTAHPGTVTVAEESTSYPMVTKPPYDGGLGFTFKWDMGFMHDTLDYLELDPLWRRGSHDKLTFSMMYAFSENFVLAFSHDEVVHGKRSMVEKMHGEYLDRFKQLRALMGLQFAHPGKKLTFMGSEFAQVIEWDFAKELDWFLLKYPIHSGMQRFSAELNAVYAAQPALWQIDDSWAGFAWANVDDRDEDAIAFLRMPKRAEKDEVEAGAKAGPSKGRIATGGEAEAAADNGAAAGTFPETTAAPEPSAQVRTGASDVLCCCNFSPNTLTGFTVGLPCAGTLTELLNSDESRFGGSGTCNGRAIRAQRGPFGDQPFHAQVTLPAFAAVYFTFERATSAESDADAHDEKQMDDETTTEETKG